MRRNNKAIKLGEGELCPKCKIPMERRAHPPNWQGRSVYHYKQWDFCIKCFHLQHYEEFKSSDWQEDERQQSFFKSLK